MKRYLKKFGRREDDQDFRDRLTYSYVPAFAKSAINEVKNSIFQRMQDISRNDGPASYKASLTGLTGGVDLLGSAMNTFIGRDILPELLTMARVGVYVDMPPLSGSSTLAEKGIKRPYLYWYKAEDIRSWALQDGSVGDPTEFKALLLRDSTYDIDQHWVLPYEVTTRYRYLWIGEDGYVHCQFYQQDGEMIYPDGYQQGEEIILPITRIPFVMFELYDSLLADTADYQIALMNLASSDMNFTLKSNYPFYTEQFDWRSDAPFMKQMGPGGAVATTQTTVDPVNANIIVAMEKTKEVRGGGASGRRYPMGTERPGFIAPPTAPAELSMAKQAQMKSEIRELVLQAVSNLESMRPSTDNNVNMNMQGLESGLSYIGCELEHGERKVADFWAMYEAADAPATVFYPKQYSLLSEEDRRAQAKDLKDLMPMVPSITFRRAVSKRIVHIVLGSKISSDDLKKIEQEIDADPVVIGDPLVIESDVINGLCDPETASLARGYPPGTADKAEAAHARRLATIAQHQAKPGLGGTSGDPAARGVPDASAEPKAPVEEKTSSQVDQTKRGQVKDRTRGEGK